MKNPIKILLWKEWRETRVNILFCTCFLIIFKLIHLYLRTHFPGYNIESGGNEGLAFIAVLFCCVYGLILGVGMFAMEYNQRTFPYLFTHPISRKSILLSKWITSIAQLIGLGFIGWIISFCDTHSPNANQLQYMISFLWRFLSSPILFFIVSVFWSILLKDMTRSTIISTISIPFGIALLSWLDTKFYVKQITGYTHTGNPFIVNQPTNIPGIIMLIIILLIGLISIYSFLRQEMK